MDNKGGRLDITIDGRTYTARGEFSLRPARAVAEPGVNMDSTGYTVVRPKLAVLEGTFDRGERTFRWDEAMILKRVNATWTERDTGRSHLLTGARFAGEPSINLATGEVSGLSLQSDSYQMVSA